MAKGQKYHCGAVQWPKWLRKFLSKYFNAACKIHDLDYSERSPFLQAEADERFKAHMDMQTSKHPKIHRILKAKACVYYWVVCKFGKKQYQGNEVAILEARHKDNKNKVA